MANYVRKKPFPFKVKYLPCLPRRPNKLARVVVCRSGDTACGLRLGTQVLELEPFWTKVLVPNTALLGHHCYKCLIDLRNTSRREMLGVLARAVSHLQRQKRCLNKTFSLILLIKACLSCVL